MMRWFSIGFALAVLLLLIILGISGAYILRTRTPSPTPTPIPEVSVTIPEGWRREEIATLLEKKQVCSAASFLAASSGLEGTLFPDTYRFYLNIPAETVIGTLTTTFTQKTAANPPTKSEIVLASIVEREAANESERDIIAGVYQNRLDLGMKLDADPTVQYGKTTNLLDEEKTVTDYWPTITRADYQQVISPFNTYRVAGLPPTPIANPGLSSIRAAQNPANHPYLYFVHRNGELRLAKTLTEHERNAAR